MHDLIIRQSAIDALRKMQTYKLFAGDDMLLIDQAQVQTELMMLPPVQPERKTGQWIQLTCDSAEWWYCSECNGRVQMNPWVKYNYCPNCGADMRGE